MVPYIGILAASLAEMDSGRSYVLAFLNPPGRFLMLEKVARADLIDPM